MNKYYKLRLAIFAQLMLCSFQVFAVDVEKDDWIDSMKTILPSAFCQDNTIFRTCYKQSEEKCHEIATQTTSSCLMQLSPQFPPIFHQPEDGKKWGTKVGGCAGTLFGISSKENRINNPQCKNL